MYKTNNTQLLIPSQKIDAEKQNELLEESVSDDVLTSNGDSDVKSNAEKDSKKVI
jgi:hypothetical protein